MNQIHKLGPVFHRFRYIGRIRILRKYLLFLFLFPFLLLMRIISPFILIRVGGTMGTRIGHFAEDIESYLCEKDHNLHPKKSFDIFFHPINICNFQLKKMWDRCPDLYINQFAWFIYHANKILPDSERYEINTSVRDTKDVLIRSKVHIEFTSNEETTAQKELLNMGIPAESTFIGFIARDSSYLQNLEPSRDWSYHNYRDSNIDNYLLAAKELSKRGHFSVRMGANVNKAIKSNDPKIIDYATKGYRTDLLDIYIPARCHFFIGGNVGLDSVPPIFRKPVVYVNYAPIEHVRGPYKNSLVLFKKHWLKDEKRFMTFSEIIDSGAGKFLHNSQFEELGIELIENTPEEIRDVVIEMDDRLKGNWETTKDDEELQQQFWSLFKPSDEVPVFRCRTGTKFLQQNKNLLD